MAATCSQALQYVAALDQRWQCVKRSAGAAILHLPSNDAQIVPAGMIDLDIENIPYKAGSECAVDPSRSGVGPSRARGRQLCASLGSVRASLGAGVLGERPPGARVAVGNAGDGNTLPGVGWP